MPIIAGCSNLGKTDLIDLIANVLDDMTTCAEFMRGNLSEIDDPTVRKNIEETYQKLIPIIPQIIEIAVHIYTNSPKKKEQEAKLVDVLNSVKSIFMMGENLIMNYTGMFLELLWCNHFFGFSTFLPSSIPVACCVCCCSRS